MNRPFRITAETTFEVEFRFSADYTPGRPATPPSYASGGDPAEADEIEFNALEAVGIVTYNSTLRKHETTWIKVHEDPLVARFVNELLFNALLAIPDFNERAMDAVSEAAAEELP